MDGKGLLNKIERIISPRGSCSIAKLQLGVFVRRHKALPCVPILKKAAGMGKIPVGQTIRHVYGFAFRRFPQILGLIWLPLVIVLIGSWLMTDLLRDASVGIATHNFTALAKNWTVLLPYYFAAAILFMAQIVAVMQFALGQRDGSAYFHLSLKQPLWKVIGAYLLVVALFFAALAVTFIVAIIIGIVGSAVAGFKPGVEMSAGSKTALGVISLVMIALIYIAALYCTIRQIFFLTPAVVSQNRIDLRQAWALGRGNFWRMLVILLAVTLPLFALQFGLYRLLGIELLPPSLMQGYSAQQIAAWYDNYFQSINRLWFILYPALAVLSALFLGFGCGAQAFAYQHLTGGSSDETR